MSVQAEASSASFEPTGEGSGLERRARLHNTIESLVKLRQEVVVSYCQLAGVSSFAARDVEEHKVEADQLRRFCQIMVDYTAMGHFEVYQRIIEGKERRRAVKDVAVEVYPAIAETTDYLVDFNDKYDAFDGSGEEVSLLSSDLSRLGEVIAIRGELEDQLLSALEK
ncbi:sigma D regulator [Granulosicoccus sp.]|nr:Rsd/AlgQ family anti-sigma factor [Granulosicoccus sp.]MDB4223007.1 sigma D regulator [Granulosicoccus sp.]